MRLLFYDKVTEIEKGKSITGVKVFSLSEEFLRHHYTKKAIVPGVVFIEAMAQLVGWLVIYSHDFNLSAIMSLVEGVRVPPMLRPGFSAAIHGEIVSTSKRDSLCKARVLVDGEEVASLNRIIFSHFQGMSREDLISRFRYYSGMEPD
ncbi:MAG: hypothetical protein HQK89_16305 [Nitrospirae bacterium]|nr:hypothetical protein [Nitrospirota bacterium]